MCVCCGNLPETVAENTQKTANQKNIILSVPDMHCGACVTRIERGLSAFDDIIQARANLTLKRLTVEMDESLDEQIVIDRLADLSFSAFQIDDPNVAKKPDQDAKVLLRAMAVAGFGAANIMLLSVSAWSGADGITRDLFHLISALIAVPVVAFSGRPFFRSAFDALSKGNVNMDVPISLAVILALGMSIFETLNGAAEVYFDAAVMLLFFLLIGRYLDQLMRARARNAVESLSQYAAKHATEILDDGTLRKIDVSEILVGTKLRLFPGSRVPADGRIIAGKTDIDRSMVTGESVAVGAQEGDTLEGGVLNLTGAVDIIVEKPADESFLAEVTKLLDAAEKGRGHYTRIADRMAKIYTPAVHILAASAFVGWMIWTGGDWHTSLLIAISVLIITCPCALGLAVPVAHVVAASRLFEQGILMRDGSALERLSEIDQIAFDKTGTLTTGMRLVDESRISEWDKPLIVALAERSTHPASEAILSALKGVKPAKIEQFVEYPGLGCEAMRKGDIIRLGRYNWASNGDLCEEQAGACFSINGTVAHKFLFDETLRDGALDATQWAKEHTLDCIILSGDGDHQVSHIADRLSIETYQAVLLPADKLGWVERQKEQGLKTLIVGDGLNDAPALAAGHVSMAPSSASDVGRHAADFIFTRENLEALPIAIKIANKANRIVRQNFGLALAYNCFAVPLALMGYVTPLFAAIAMSASSIIVISNSLRLASGRIKGAKRPQPYKPQSYISHGKARLA